METEVHVGGGGRCLVDVDRQADRPHLDTAQLVDVIAKADPNAPAEDVRELAYDLCLKEGARKDDLDTVGQWVLKVREMYADIESRREDAREASVDAVRRLEETWKLVRRLNRYVEETKPWELAKDEADPERLDEVLYNLIEGLRVTTLLLLPYLPRTGETLLAALGEEERALAELGSRPGGQKVERVPSLFPKIEPPSPDG